MEYGAPCTLQLTKLTVEKQAVRASQVAEVEGLSVDYVAKIMQIVRKKGLITSTRGNQGGFRLSRDLKDLSLKNVVECLQVKKYEDKEFCDLCTDEECAHNSEYPLRPVWTTLFSYFDEVLGAISLSDLMMKEKESKIFVRSLASKKSKEVISRLKVS